jgi:prepilin-type N-terminal cleavage/methylation domain-containing protein
MQRQAGLTLIELMIVVAILTIIAAIAIPAYNGYIREAKLGVARQNMDTLRLFLEDYYLENGTYKAGGSSSFTQYGATTEIEDNFNWTPDGDQGLYSYLVTATTNSYDILARYNNASPWMLCEGRMNTCCDDKEGASTSSCD